MPNVRVFIGADHAGFELKEQLKPYLEKQGFSVEDVSGGFVEGDDYPVHAKKVAQAVAKHPGSRGVLVCGSGVGVTIGANRVKGIRAFDAYDEQTTKLAREHNDANVIALSGWHLKKTKAQKILETFFSTKASPAERHLRRVEQLG